VTVLYGDDLRARGVTTVALALREVPGAMVVQSGSFGAVTSLFLRGGESRYTKVLIDGVPVNDVGGFFSFDNLTTDNIDRIEILRGPASALYGADAMTGVVQIFTRTGTQTPLKLDIGARAGSYRNIDGDATVHGGNAFGTFSIAGAMHRSDGMQSFNNQFFDNVLSGALRLTPDAATTISLASRYNTSEFHNPVDGLSYTLTDSNAYTTAHRLAIGLDVARDIAPWLTLHAIGADNDTRGISGQASTDAGVTTRSLSPSTSYRRQGEFRADLRYGALAQLFVGAQYMKESQETDARTITLAPSTAPSDSTTAYPRLARITRAYYAALQGSPFSAFSYDASVRYEDHQDFKNSTTFHLGARYTLPTATSIRVSYGTAFNAPSLDKTQGSLYNLPNSKLQPEQAHSVDAALEQSLWQDRVRASFGVFEQHFSQQIQYVYDPAGSIYDNLTAVHAKGYESELHALIVNGLTADLNYTQTIARVYSVSPTYTGSQQPGDALIRRPSHTGSANVSYVRNNIGSLAATASYVGKRSDQDFVQFPSPFVTLPSYVRLDLSASADVIRTLDNTIALTARVENVTDKKYSDVLYYQSPGRVFYLGFRLTSH
jgi:vitamin B12 transporter